MHGWKAFSFHTPLFFIQKPMLWSFALHKRGNKMDKENKKWNNRRKRERNVVRISTWRFGRDRPEENLSCFYFRCPSNVLHFPLLSSASQVLLFIREGSLEPSSTLALWLECNHLGRGVIPWEYKFNSFSPRRTCVSDFILIMAS